MYPVYDSATIRAAEEPLLAAQTAPDQLMRRAAHAVAQQAASLLQPGARVLVLAGAGGNGGDALYAAAELTLLGASCEAILVDSQRRHHERSLEELRSVGGRLVERPTGTYDLVIDGILGIGGSGGLREPAAALWQEARAACRGKVLAVDVPSGVAADTGEAGEVCVTADVTVTFGGLRYAHLLSHACGDVVLADIGLPLPATRTWGYRALESCGWPSLAPGAGDDKYSGGVVGLCAGSARYPGAGILAARAAVASTSSMVRVVGSSDIVRDSPEVVWAPTVAESGRVQAWVVGPGRGLDCAEELRTLLRRPEALVVDADALTVLAGDPALRALVRERSALTVLTPHAGEFARLHPLDGDRLAATRDLATELHCVVLLKGRTTLVVDGTTSDDPRTHLVDAGSSWAATPGSGDVLAGMIGAFVARAPQVHSVVRAVITHAVAAAIAAETPDGPAPTSASRIAAAIPQANARVSRHA